MRPPSSDRSAPPGTRSEVAYTNVTQEDWVMTKSGDVITGSKGPVALPDRSNDEINVEGGDEVTTSVAGATTTNDSSATTVNVDDVEVDATLVNTGDRDWTDVHNRVLSIAGLNKANLPGTLTYTEDGIDDDGVEKLEGQTLKAGAAPGTGRSIGTAAKAMGYGVSFKAAPKDKAAA